MMEALAPFPLSFHFLRPLWLLLVAGALVLLLLWRLNSDPRAQWRRFIAPHLLDALIIGEKRRFRVRPIHAIGVLLIVGGIAAAGPTWEEEPPPFSQDKAPLIVAIDLSRSMDASDISPTRLERVKQKVHDLMAERKGSRTGLVVYAGTAHLVLPPAEDPALMDIFLEALSTGLMPRDGRNVTAALAQADRLLAKESAAGTVVFFTDGFDAAQEADFARAVAARPDRQVMLVSVGTKEGGPVLAANGRPALDKAGRPIIGSFDAAALEHAANAADVLIASSTLDDEDIRWVQRRAQKHLQAVEAEKAQLRWKEPGYWLCFPIALIAALSFRRGWVLRWLPVLLLACMAGMPKPAQAAGFNWLDAFLTPDQQGRMHFERGEFAEAASHFEDAQWKAWAYYRARNYGQALTLFARQDSPESFLMMGNCYAQLGEYAQAVSAYDNALRGRPTYVQAKHNRELVAALIPKAKPPEEQGEEGPNLKPDEVKFDNKTGGGKLVQVKGKKLSAEVWMRNLQTTPAEFLRQKFAIQAQEGNGAAKTKAKAAQGGAQP
ncbi:VWA domain-containing protein [Niveibacterium sp. SC-1]|uniref:vWA domain-containing protein n=1 Tax=Niveibacterium sp. SC-1 TaxID=3135646 RepID=UPI00311DA2F2